jgi:phospholipid transport system substrate-binding protein
MNPEEDMVVSPYRSLVLAVLLALATGVLTDAHAGEPTDQVRAQIDQLYRAVEAPGPPPRSQRQAADIMDRLFDWPGMAEAALRAHWRALTAAERAEFSRLFAELFKRAYLSRVLVVDASKFEYLGDTVQGDWATVKTKVFTARGSGIDVDYAVHLMNGREWRVQDVRVEQVSLVDNYRAQFESFIARSSYAALVAKLRTLTQ